MRNICIIKIYAPTEEVSHEEETKFYYQLEESTTLVKKRDIMIMMGDLNAKVGRDYRIRENYGNPWHRINE